MLSDVHNIEVAAASEYHFNYFKKGTLTPL